ncbi:MAG: NADH-quinone oxidoreductase subunit A [SAR324 cluster bacterium]|nr:NADH-quinone oxidoreductase subunit A [SAR324 cluster bacterium]
MSYILVLLLMILPLFLIGIALGVSHLFAPQNPGLIKSDAYECGEKTIGPSRLPFNVGYYQFALMFLIFDVEAAFLFPWAVVLRETGIIGFVEAGIFILILLTGLIYAWKKGVLEWV